MLKYIALFLVICLTSAHEFKEKDVVILPQTLHIAGSINCSFESSPFIDIMTIWLSGERSDNLYFFVPITASDDYTRITAGSAHLYYGYYTITFAKYQHVTNEKLPEYGFFNDNHNSSIYLSYTVEYKCNYDIPKFFYQYKL